MERKFCVNCGKDIERNNNFCSSCGIKISKVDGKANIIHRSEGPSIEEPLSSTPSAVMNSEYVTKKGLISLFISLFYMGTLFYFVLSVLILGLGWDVTSSLLLKDYSGRITSYLYLYPVVFLIGIAALSYLFKRNYTTMLVAKITFFVCLFILVAYPLHLLTTVYYLLNTAYYVNQVGSLSTSLIKTVTNMFESHYKMIIDILIISMIGASTYVSLTLNRAFKKQSVKFKDGIENILKNPTSENLKRLYSHLF